MRKFLVAAGVAGLLLLGLLASEASAQGFQRGGKKNRGNGGGRMDPGRFFDMLAQGKSAIVIADVKMTKMRDSLQEFAQANGITNGQITREQYTDYSEWVKERMGGGKGAGRGAVRTRREEPPPPAPSESTEPSQSASLEPSRPPEPEPGLKSSGSEELPRGLPEWFRLYDTDRDGQVSLFEWSKANQPLDRFLAMDRNNDGLLTADEVLFYLERHRRTGDEPRGGTRTAKRR